MRCYIVLIDIIELAATLERIVTFGRWGGGGVLLSGFNRNVKINGEGELLW